MISFKQFITESKSAPLYHSTQFENLTLIMETGILSTTYHPEHKLLTKARKPDAFGALDGVSTTRSLAYAKSYRPYGAIIELDQNAIQHRYRVIPVNFWQNSMNQARIQDNNTNGSGNRPSNEFEEFIVTSKPIPVKFITAVYIRKDTIMNRSNEIMWNAIKAEHPNIKFKVLK